MKQPSEPADGGPAFPLTEGAVNYQNRQFQMQGMSLRDWFAGKALQGLIAHHGDSGWSDEGAIQSMRGAADAAYEYADAMLAARHPAEARETEAESG